MLMGTHDGAVDHRVFVVGVAGQHGKDARPNTGFCPARKTRVDFNRVAEPLGKITPWNTCSVPVQNRLDEQTVVPRGHPNIPDPAGKQVLNPLPLIVSKSIAAHCQPPTQLTRYESRDSPRRNPPIEDRP